MWIAGGLSAWKYSELSDWMKMASGRRFNISIMASTFALTMCFRAVTKLRSSVACSFHQPYLAEKIAQMNISLTGRVELHPGEAVGEGAGIGGEELREIGILEIADPVRHAEMAEVDDRRDVAPLQLARR